MKVLGLSEPEGFHIEAALPMVEAAHRTKDNDHVILGGGANRHWGLGGQHQGFRSLEGFQLKRHGRGSS